MQLDIDFVRAQFPAFDEPTLDGFAHFENAGGSYASGATIDLLNRYYRCTKLQPYAFSAPSIEAGQLMDRARKRFAQWLNVQSEEVHFGPSTTQNTYVLAQALRRKLRSGDEIIVTNLDHEANIGAFRRLADDGFTVRQWSLDPQTGELRLDDLRKLLNERTAVVAFTHCSNIVGSYNPVAEIVELAHGVDALTIVDGVSYCGHGLPDVGALGADVYLFSLYKVYGPHQGVMVVRSEVNEQLPNQGHFFNDAKPTYRLTPAGPDHAQIAAANGVIDYFESLFLHHAEAAGDFGERARLVRKLMQDHEHALLQPLLDFVDAHPRARLLGRRESADRAPTVSLDTERDPVELARNLAQQRIGVGASHFYAWRCLEALGINPERGVLRLSFVHYTHENEVTALIGALDRLL